MPHSAGLQRHGGGSGDDDGAVYVFWGPVAGSHDTSDADGALSGSAKEDYAGTHLAGGDLNGDGIHDLVVGAPGFDGTGGDEGAAFLLFGGPGE